MLLIPISYILSKNSYILLISIEDYFNYVKNSSYVFENINVNVTNEEYGYSSIIIEEISTIDKYYKYF